MHIFYDSWRRNEIGLVLHVIESYFLEEIFIWIVQRYMSKTAALKITQIGFQYQLSLNAG